MATFIVFLAAITLAAILLLSRRQAAKRAEHEFHRTRRRATRIHHRNNQGIAAKPWQRRHTRPENPDARKYEGRWR